ncbi:hypothetical protein AKO1_000566 [Acrasis kona]|uniref:Uncharacterized protein n=1 Tax=Acrasis kona TaxID=1008807 RepID=A0AAW2Z376_9EUKA
MIPKGVRMVRRRECVCELCQEGKALQDEVALWTSDCHLNCPENCTGGPGCIASENDIDYVTTLENRAKFCTNHYNSKKHQETYQAECFDKLEPGRLVVVQDFSFLLCGDRRDQNQAGWFSKSTFGWLIIVLCSKDKIGGKLKPKSTQDSKFVQTCWDKLLNEQDILKGLNCLQIFSDGTSKHFKCINTITYYSFLKELYPNIHMEYNFTVTGHGKGLSDMKASQGKGYTKRDLMKEDDYLTSLAKVPDMFTSIVTSDIQNHRDTVRGKTIKGIRSIHQIVFKVKNNSSLQDKDGKEEGIQFSAENMNYKELLSLFEDVDDEDDEFIPPNAEEDMDPDVDSSILMMTIPRYDDLENHEDGDFILNSD